MDDDKNRILFHLNKKFDRKFLRLSTPCPEPEPDRKMPLRLRLQQKTSGSGSLAPAPAPHPWCAAMRSNFHQNRPKIEVFWIFRARKNRKAYFLLSDRLKDFIVLLLSYHTHLYLYCALNAHGCAVIFTKNGPKIEVFGTFRGRKNRKINFLSKKSKN